MSNQSIKPFRFPIDSFEKGFGFLADLSLQETRGQPQTGQRRSKLVRDIAEEPSLRGKQLFLTGDQLLDAVCHVVEVLAELGKFVAPGEQRIVTNASSQIASGKP